jgi:hypothetical protein
MSCDCSTDCGLRVDVEYVDLAAERPSCIGPDRIWEASQILGEYPGAGDFSKYDYDLVIDQDMEVNQRVRIPDTHVWRACRDLIINDGILIVDGTLILGED